MSNDVICHHPKNRAKNTIFRDNVSSSDLHKIQHSLVYICARNRTNKSIAWWVVNGMIDKLAALFQRLWLYKCKRAYSLFTLYNKINGAQLNLTGLLIFRQNCKELAPRGPHCSNLHYAKTSCIVYVSVCIPDPGIKKVGYPGIRCRVPGYTRNHATFIR